MPEIVRATKLKVDIPLEVAEDTLERWAKACNAVSSIAFDEGCISNAVRLHRLGYQTAKSFGLSAQVAASCIRTVASKYAAARTKKFNPKTPFRFRPQGMVLQGGAKGRDVSVRKSGLSIWTCSGRIKAVPFKGPPQLSKYLANWKLGDGRLFTKNRKVYLTLSFKLDVEPIHAPSDAVVGVDMGINVLAAVTDGQRQQFFDGGRTKFIRHRYLTTRASLQRKKAQRPTRSVRRVLKRLSGRSARFMQDTNHVTSKRIVQFALETGNPTIAVERLRGIRQKRGGARLNQARHSWAYGQLREFIRYKAEGVGMSMIEVDPRNTSRGCNRCGHTEAANRHGLQFLCRACGYALHADLNAARNIRLRGILSRQALGENGVPSTTPKARSADPSPDGEETGKLPVFAGGS